MKDDAALRPPADADPQTVPVSLPGKAGEGPALLKIDAAVRLDDLFLIAGWSTGPEPALCLWQGDRRIDGDVTRTDRADVAASLGRAEGRGLGFVLIAAAPPGAVLGVETGAGSHRFALRTSGTVPDHAVSLLRPALRAQLSARPVGSPHWCRLMRLLPEGTAAEAALQGCIDAAMAGPGSGAEAAQAPGLGWCSGWISHAPGTLVWLEDDRGGVHGLAEAHRWIREDVRQIVTELYDSDGRTGFVVRIAPVPGATTIRLCACGPAAVFRDAPVPIQPMAADPVRAAAQMLAVPTPLVDFPERARQVDLGILGPLRRRQAARWAGQRLRQADVGPQPAAPRVSVIVPLYGRMDFVEHQLLEFRRDPGFLAEAELIYVIDDPEMEPAFRLRARDLQRLCGCAFRWIGGGGNRGFAAANNMGAGIARADRLIFLNSDVFPIAPGWAGALCDVLDAHPGIGLVGPRLLFPDGSLQHAGMQPQWNDEFQLWINHHPLMGMDPEADPARGLTRVPLLTGACLAIRKGDFERAGGWNTDYLVGDFEDSDLCLRIAERGLGIAYLPEVSLIHLERQSFERIGESPLRQRITLLNAVRYNLRWADRLGGAA